MSNLLFALLILAQEPSVAELLRRLEGGDIDVREKAELQLIARGAPALAEVEAELARADGVEYRLRLRRVVLRLRFADLLARIPSQFSEGFRRSEPDLLLRLKTGDPGALIEGIAATTGHATHWELVEGKSSPDRIKVPREIKREPAKGAVRSDAAEMIRLALRATPESERDAPWRAVFYSAWQAIQPAEREDRRRLFPELFPSRKDEQVRRLLLLMISHCREEGDSPILLTALDEADPEIQKRAAETLSFVHPGSHAAEFEKRLEAFKPPLRRYLLYPLKASGDARFLKTFEEYLHSSVRDERIICLEALRKLAPDTLPAHYLKWIRSKDPDRVGDGLQLSLGMPNQTAAKPSVELLAEARNLFSSTKDPRIRGGAFQLLKRGPPEKFRETVLEALGDGRPEVHMIGIGAARDISGDDIRKALEKLADSTLEMTALEANAVLLTLTSPPSVDRIRPSLKAKDPKVRSRAVFILAQHARENSREDLVPMLDDPDPGVQRDALQNLSWNAKGLEERIRKFLESKDEYTVLVATRVLAGLGDRSCLPAIRMGMKTYRYRDYLSCLIYMFEPTWNSILEIAFKIPDKDPTVKDVVEGVRTALKEKSVEVRFEFPDEKLGQKFFQPGISPGGWPLGWIRTMIKGSDYFFDGKTLFILPEAEARKRWSAWAEGK